MTMAENNFDFPEDILRECVRQKYSSIVGSFEPTGYVLNSLFEAGTITKDEKQPIERLPERRSAALVDWLYTCRRPKAIAQFLEILSNKEMTACKWMTDEVHKAAQEKVVSTSTPSLEVGTNSVQMTTTAENRYGDILEQCVHEMYSKIVAGFDPKGYILDSLFEKGTITIQEKQQIERLSEGRGAALVDKLFLSRNSDAIPKFLEIVSSSTEPAWKWIPDEVHQAAQEKFDSSLASSSGSDRTVDPGRPQICQNYDKVDLKNCHPSDIIRGFREVQSKGPDLEDYIDPENGLLNRLYNQRVFDYSEVDILTKITPYQKLNGELLRRIDYKINTSSKDFIQALCQDDQDHIAKFIVTAGCETDSDERLLPRELRKVIDDNMFCLEKLIDTENLDLLHQLVRAKCITSRHRDRVIDSKPECKAYELLIIIQRRRYRDFRKFVECQRKNIVNILERGGVTEIKIQFQEAQGDNRKLVAELIKKLRGYVDDDDESDLDGDQKRIVINFLAELAENCICFIGIFPEITSLDSDMSMFFQGKKDDSFEVLKEGCESGALKGKLEAMIRSLIPDRLPPLVKEVRTGEHSNKHHVTIQTDRSSGKLGCTLISQLRFIKVLAR